MERIHRKISLSLLDPYQFVGLNIAYNQIVKIIDYVLNRCVVTNKLLPSHKVLDTFNNFIHEYTSDFDMEKIGLYNLNNITNSFFNKGREPSIDKIQNDLDECFLFMENFKRYLSDIVEKDSNFVKLNKTEKDGYYFSITNKRSLILKKHLKNMGNHSIKIKVGHKTIKIKANDIFFPNRKKSEAVIDSKVVEKYANNIFK